ncbi:MAG: hypothetical protein ACI86H_001230 [bacterium]|jgi:hypothetical protein
MIIGNKHPQNFFDWPDEKLGLYDAMLLIETEAAFPFSFSWIVNEIKQHCYLRNPQPEDHIQRILNESFNLGVVHSPNPTYYPARYLFENRSFRVYPTEEEIENGILIPGHRFYPWVSFFVPPSEVNLHWKGKEQELILYESSIEHLNPYYNLLSSSEIFSVLEAVDPYHFDVDAIEEFLTPAFDVQSFYDEHNIQEGDQFEIRVKDYLKGTIEILPISREVFFSEKKDSLTADHLILDDIHDYIMETGEQSFPVKGILDCYARLENQGKYPEVAPTGWPKLISNNNSLHICSFQESAFLSAKNQDDEEVVFNILNEHLISDGRCETIDDLLSTGHCDLDSTTLRAYIINEMLKGRDTSLEKLLDHIFHYFPIRDLSEAQNRIFEELYEALCAELITEQEQFHKDEVGTKLRSKGLELMEDSREILLNLLKNDPDIDVNIITQLRTVQENLCDTLDLLENASLEVDHALVAQQLELLKEFLREIRRDQFRGLNHH